VSAWQGARVFRAHDVAETREVLDMVASIRGTEHRPGRSAASAEPSAPSRSDRRDQEGLGRAGDQPPLVVDPWRPPHPTLPLLSVVSASMHTHSPTGSAGRAPSARC
jgi:hypothetical protein